MKTKMLFGTTLLSVSLILAGCGGNEETTTNSENTLAEKSSTKINIEVPDEVKKVSSQVIGGSAKKVTKEKFADGEKNIVSILDDSNNNTYLSAILTDDGSKVISYRYAGSITSELGSILLAIGISTNTASEIQNDISTIDPLEKTYETDKYHLVLNSDSSDAIMPISLIAEKK